MGDLQPQKTTGIWEDMMQELVNKVGMIITFVVLVSLVIGGLLGYVYAPNKHSNEEFDNFREIYHNDYITTIKLLIQDCSELGNQSLVVVRHLVDISSRHLGIMYRCSSPKPNNLTLSIQYTKQFYELK